ncbi:Transcription factor bHLH96 [Heracleum sosnowskyi]|uniref:Transcription factor bHLH96 n=1 Tax=Heracleum sosnowskyi TaxID=360622 RepID=A0AAD8I7S2_9APIA|nr:Transcription factor bHLH96 [Heracleum sosnowskyi]
MAMEALCSNEVFNLILYDPTPYINNSYSPNSFPASPNFLLENPKEFHLASSPPNPNNTNNSSVVPEIVSAQGRKKRRRRSSKVCKNKEEAESQRMTHIAVERNRRKLMNEHLAVLRSLMPESYVERGDQASIVGGAITFVKELEHLLQTLEAKKIQQSQETKRDSESESTSPTPFSQFFAFPQYSFCSQMPNKYTRSKSNGGDAEIEVTLIESHANIRVLCPRRPRQLSKLLSGFHSIYLTLLHLNVTTLDPLVLYSVSAKVEEGCQQKSADDIAMAVNQILKMIQEDANLSLA